MATLGEDFVKNKEKREEEEEDEVREARFARPRFVTLRSPQNRDHPRILQLHETQRDSVNCFPRRSGGITFIEKQKEEEEKKEQEEKEDEKETRKKTR